MKLSKVVCFALIAAMPFAVQAKRSSIVPLTGGTAGPGEEVYLVNSDLYEDVDYDVTCGVRIAAKESDFFSHIKVSEGTNKVRFAVNFEPLPATGQSFIRTNEYSIIQAKHFSKDTHYIVVRNLDRENSMTVDQCVAYPSDINTSEMKK